jgi:hypothetical protein
MIQEASGHRVPIRLLKQGDYFDWERNDPKKNSLVVVARGQEHRTALQYCNCNDVPSSRMGSATHL